jgi:phenylacetate-CoA ligase
MNFYDLDPVRQQEAARERLFKYVRNYVAPYHPFLRRRCREQGIDLRNIRSAEEFSRLPLIDKNDLARNPLMFILRPSSSGAPPLPDGFESEPLPKHVVLRHALTAVVNLPRDPAYLVRRDSLKEKTRRNGMLEWLPIHTHASSGSSGDPVPVMFTYHDFHRVIREMASLIPETKLPTPGLPRFHWDDRKLSIFPGAPHVAFYAPVIAKILVGTPSFETFGGAVIPTERQITMFAAGGFQTLLAIPSYLVYWLRRAIEMQRSGKVGPLTNLRRVVLGAEPVSEPLRNYIIQLAAEVGAEPPLKILQTAGMTEMKWTFIECTERSGVHLNPKFYYWELLHPDTRQPVKPGEPGVLVFTHIGWRGTVLVRYWTGDLIQGGLIWDRCPHCGWTFPRIFPPICRAEADFSKIKGARVELPLLIETVRDTPGVRYFQVTLDHEGDAFSRDVMIVRILPEAGVEREPLARLLSERIKTATEVTPDQIVFEDSSESAEAAFVSRLFARTGVKAQNIVERRRGYERT